eukprot:TRINITY_DN6378_c0_g4_i2.p1 TRINITY_DN6378_c0_g4~~TRINITY_DN6378_c0_g4_i2.p1  ORF type:complete len:338 (-),score=66.97 TRINITY_DN6378_c0_g4_i2:167-1180(-)
MSELKRCKKNRTLSCFQSPAGSFFSSQETSSSTQSFQKCIENLKGILSLSITNSNFILAARVYQTIGEVFLLSKDISKAISYFAQAVYIYEAFGLWLAQSGVYEKIGQCYIRLGMHREALAVFKILLVLGWKAHSHEIELKAYDNIGIAYYHLGKLDVAQYYHNRMWGGICEAAKSPWLKSSYVKTLSSQLYKELHERLRVKKHESISKARVEKFLSDEMGALTSRPQTPKLLRQFPWEKYDPDDLPSPRKGSMPEQPVKAMTEKAARELRHYIEAKFLKREPLKVNRIVIRKRFSQHKKTESANEENLKAQNVMVRSLQDRSYLSEPITQCASYLA